ncbi:hypothetical protein AAE478_007684 [Parahypoxylon ruwenzoriense]
MARAHPYSRPPQPEAYPDAWTAEDDPGHQVRVNIFRKHRDSAASSVGSRCTTPAATPKSCASTVLGKADVGGESPFKDTPWRRERQSSVALSTDLNSPALSPPQLVLTESLQDELDRYEEMVESMRDREWVAPPRPRSRAKRIDGKQFSRERAQALKRWSHAQAFMYGQTTSSLRETDKKHPVSVYVPGLIFSAPQHTASSSDEMYVLADDPNLTATPFGTVHSKYRKMIVLRIYGEHCTCVPIYSHNGRGLEGKEFPKEFVSIRDINDPSPAPEEGPHTGLLAVRDEGFSNATFIGGRSVVKLTETYSHRYDAPATIEGRLDRASLSRQRLFELVTSVGA